MGEDEIRILAYFEGEVMEKEWREAVGGDFFCRRPIELEPIPARIEELYDRLNENLEITAQEEAEICSYTGQYARPEVGGYPIVDVINQVGGRSFLCQRLDDPDCPLCEKAMPFIASLTNDKRQSLFVGYEGVQIVFFFCTECHVIHVRHSAD
jgi:hypothetical protein